VSRSVHIDFDPVGDLERIVKEELRRIGPIDEADSERVGLLLLRVAARGYHLGQAEMAAKLDAFGMTVVLDAQITDSEGADLLLPPVDDDAD
jgi:hypothetical protein